MLLQIQVSATHAFRSSRMLILCNSSNQTVRIWECRSLPLRHQTSCNHRSTGLRTATVLLNATEPAISTISAPSSTIFPETRKTRRSSLQVNTSRRHMSNGLGRCHLSTQPWDPRTSCSRASSGRPHSAKTQISRRGSLGM